MKSKKIVLVLLAVMTLSTSCMVGEDEKFGATSCYNDRDEMIDDLQYNFKESLDAVPCPGCSDYCDRSATLTGHYVGTLQSFKSEWRKSPGNCTEKETAKLESYIDDQLAYWGEFLEDYIRCSK